MTKDNKKAYRKVRIAVHETIDESEKSGDKEWTVYSTSFMRHLRQPDGSVKIDQGQDGSLPVEMFLSALVNTMASVIADEFKGEAAMRSEFERIAPLMKTGGFIPSVDHQTPPSVSMENYRIFLKLLNEYTN